MKIRLFDKKGEIKNEDRKDGTYTEKEVVEAKKYIEPNGRFYTKKIEKRADEKGK